MKMYSVLVYFTRTNINGNYKRLSISDAVGWLIGITKFKENYDILVISMNYYGYWKNGTVFVWLNRNYYVVYIAFHPPDILVIPEGKPQWS